MKVTKKSAALVTLAYADVFDYALTPEELMHWLVYVPDKKQIIAIRGACIHEGFWVFRGREHIVALRRRRAKQAKHKYIIAEHIAEYLKYIPTLELVGITGALAMDNADKHDDIDVICIVSPRTLWISRLVITLVVSLFATRRVPGETHTRNAICLNMFITTQSLGVPEREQDLFTSHEVLQMKPLWERGGVYTNFLLANSWVSGFLPNAWIARHGNSTSIRTVQKTSIGWCMTQLLRICETPSKYAQLLYMHRRRTTEVISDTVLRFHPRDARRLVKHRLKSRLSHFFIPLDKIF